MELISKTPSLILELELDQDLILQSRLYLFQKGFRIETHGKPLPQSIRKWLEAYLFQKKLLPLPFLAKKDFSPFQAHVQEALIQVGFGEVISYAKLAQRVGNNKAARAIGQACHRNPFPLFVGCHRIIRNDQTLGGFAYDAHLKRSLLEFEKSFS